MLRLRIRLTKDRVRVRGRLVKGCVRVWSGYSLNKD